MEEVGSTWRDTPQLVVQNSTDAAGFHRDPQTWFIWNHDVYGWKFQRAWNQQQQEEEEESKNEEQEEPQVSNEAFNLNETDCALDDIDLIDT
ncbi:unnamed protein product [Phytophthora lilii]|uniref:Unnamed protein product n=1 Tax=Phytophthora lilii TaxID=2077276 RepID=A0A9W7D9K0_9STRA|nr:unnamed protein product [Phytophthora lilii]